MTSEQENDLAATYGPAAQYSDYRRGDTITYQIDGFTYRGEILWACAPSKVGDRDLPLRYVVAPALESGFVDIVFPSEVVQDCSR